MFCDYMKVFHTVTVSVLLYGCTIRTLMKCLEKKLEKNYTNPGSSTPQNGSCKVTYLQSHKPSKIRRATHAGYCWRSMNELINNVLLWIPTYGHTSVDWPAKSYLYQLCADTEYRLEDLHGAMATKDRWRDRENQKNPCLSNRHSC